jgi:hypothetical protein
MVTGIEHDVLFGIIQMLVHGFLDSLGVMSDKTFEDGTVA